MKLLTILAFSLTVVSFVRGHGYLKDPLSRASRWRDNIPGPIEFTDNQLNCGGRNVQWSKHGGKCGTCGDEYGISKPRFVYPGAFANNPPIVKTYTEGSLIRVTVRITAAHKGYFIFRVAPLVNAPITQAQLNKNVLELENGDRRWNLGDQGAGDYTITLRLPSGLSCEHCVLQWWWTTGNNWMGNQPETFVNCADIKILSASGNPQADTASPNPQPDTAAPNPQPTTGAVKTNAPPPSGCRAISPTATDAWCTANCLAGFCPASHCICTQSSRRRSVKRGIPRVWGKLYRPGRV